MNHRKIIGLSLVALLTACASAPPQPGCAPVGRDGQLCLLPPSALPAVDASHIVTVTRGGKQDTFLGRLHIDAQALHLAGFSLFGTNLFTLEYDGRTITHHPEQMGLHPELLVVMLEIALADPATLQSRLRNLRLAVNDRDGTETRTLSGHGQVIAQIEKTGKPMAAARIRIAIPPAKLSVQLTPLASTAAQP